MFSIIHRSWSSKVKVCKRLASYPDRLMNRLGTRLAKDWQNICFLYVPDNGGKKRQALLFQSTVEMLVSFPGLSYLVSNLIWRQKSSFYAYYTQEKANKIERKFALNSFLYLRVVKSGISGRYLTAIPGFNCWEGGAVTVLLICVCWRPSWNCIVALLAKSCETTIVSSATKYNVHSWPPSDIQSSDKHLSVFIR